MGVSSGGLGALKTILPALPQAALGATEVDHVATLEDIAALLIQLTQTTQRGRYGASA